MYLHDYYVGRWDAGFTQLSVCVQGHSSVLHCTSFLSYFEKIQGSSNVGGLSVCIFVALCVCMCVAVASCDDGPILGWRYYELLLGTNEVFASDMTLLKVNQGLFDAAILVLHNFLVFYCGKRCLEA